MGKRTGLRVESSHFLRNTAGITSVEFFWGMGMPVLVESTFLQLFLRSLGASYFLIGLLPVFLGLSIPVFSLFSAYLSSRLHRKRSSVILFHMAAAVPVALFGLFLLIVTPEEGVLQLFIAVYFLFSVGVGFTLPAWQNYLVSLFTHRDSLRALSVMYVVQSVSKVVGSIVVYQTVARFALSVQGASLVFTFAGCILFFGALLFLLTREEYDPDNAPPPFAGPLDFISRLRGILSSPRFRTFIAADFSYFAVIVVLSFYGNYAREFGGIPEELVAGAFVAVSYGGGILVQVVFGWLNVFSLRGKMVVSKLLGIAGAVLLIPAASPALFFLSAALLGGGRALRMLMYPPAVKALARSRDVTPHFAVIALVELPFSTGLPLLTGLFLDHFSYLQGDHYRLLFLFAALLLGLGLYFSARLDFTDHGEESDWTAGA